MAVSHTVLPVGIIIHGGSLGVGEDRLCLPLLTQKERFCQILNNFAMLLHELSNALGHVTNSLTGSPSRMRPVAEFS